MGKFQIGSFISIHRSLSQVKRGVMSFKDFRVLETVGKGSFASVYKVREASKDGHGLHGAFRL